MLNFKNNKAFTLVEIIISVAIFGIIMISIMAIFIISSDTSLKADINRAMHENVKSVVSEIAEDIRKNGINGVSESGASFTCGFSSNGDLYKKGTKLCTLNNEYYLAHRVSGTISRAEISSCNGINEYCFIARKKSGDNPYPLTNSLVTVKDLSFYVSENDVNKVTLNIIFQPSVKAGVKADLIKNNELIFQTTISERPF